jgi:hypothetical protein
MVMRHVKPRSGSHYSLDVRDEKLSSGGWRKLTVCRLDLNRKLSSRVKTNTASKAVAIPQF